MKAPGAADWSTNTDTLPHRGTSAGGGYSTVEDLKAFADALLQAELDGCTPVIRTGGAPLKAAFQFRKTTRMLVHEMQAFRELERFMSKVVKDGDSLIGVAYGERCDRS
jgi:hypothetical protein